MRSTRRRARGERGRPHLHTFTDPAGAHHAGHITTKGKFAGGFGYYEARARFRDSAGHWCAFFLYPSTIGNPLGNPAVAGVEIDIFEHRERDTYGWEMDDMVQVGLNWDGFGADWKKSARMVAHPRGAPLKGEWHDYSVLWTPSGHTFYIDEQPVFTTSAAVSHIAQPIYLTCEVKNGSWAGSSRPAATARARRAPRGWRSTGCGRGRRWSEGFARTPLRTVRPRAYGPAAAGP